MVPASPYTVSTQFSVLVAAVGRSDRHYLAADKIPPAARAARETSHSLLPSRRHVRLRGVRARDIDPPKTAFITINGRRWRTSDPRIPLALRRELVKELMSARRAVRDAATEPAVRSSRGRVHDAKIALGERGRGWWLPPTVIGTNRRIEAAIRALLRNRRGGSICPSDVARIVGGATWRTILSVVRDRAVHLAQHGEVEIVQGGRVVKKHPTAGVLRYRFARKRK